MPTLLIVDDHPMMRQGIRQLIELQDDISVIGEASNGDQALKLAIELAPDIILLDLNMKGMNGIQTLLAMREKDVSSHILVLTVSDSHEDVIAAIRAGADGYLLKDLEPEELLDALSQAVDGQMVISPQLTKALAKALRNERDPTQDILSQITVREKQILKLIAKGYANKPIANSLGITEATVKVHVKNLLKKLKLRSRVEAAVWAVEHNIE